YTIIFLPLQASHKSDPGKHHKSDTISQELEMEEQLKSKGKEKPTTHCRNKSIDSSRLHCKLRDNCFFILQFLQAQERQPNTFISLQDAKTKKTKESKKASASDHNNSTEEQEEAPQSSSSSSSSSNDSNSSSSDDSNN
ncbi:hypothetical protein DB41_CG00020, partial [Neochlamydia sp. TUME1]|uniref:hypothetical protein n=1 Tax=Neochlamydia sp. TUME1 TaxID=1478174 RepID=UPI000582F353